MFRYKLGLFLFTLLAALSVAPFSNNLCAVDNHEDDFLYNKMATIEGIVWILNHPSLGKTLANNSETILFQRADCKKCVVAAVTDEKGHYKVRVRQGRYKAIIRYGSQEGEMEDVLAQISYVL